MKFIHAAAAFAAALVLLTGQLTLQAQTSYTAQAHRKSTTRANASAQNAAAAQADDQGQRRATRDDLLRGGYGPYRANNDLLFYGLKVRVDPVAKTIKGSNAVRFRMLADGQRIQLELTPELQLDGITMNGRTLKYTREERTLWIDFPEVLQKGREYTVDIAYSGRPMAQGRFGCFSFGRDREGKPWITTACEQEGPSLWWPNKDQWRDEPQDGMEIDVSVPNGLTDVSNGRFLGSRDLGDGYTEWRWRVHYPINNYNVALNIGDYQHFSGGTHGQTTLDYYVLPDDVEKAKVQFEQVPEMLNAYEHYFGEYPFDDDGYKLIEVPYAGMEHQSAIAYGNHFQNGYYGDDWTGAGISLRFDFIIIHESGHEWFGNAITAADRADMWIHEGWTTYMETLYVEYRWGRPDALRYLDGLKPKVKNAAPILPSRGINAEPPEDQYYKGALMLNTLRSVIGDDARWFADIHDFYQHFKYQTIMTDDVVRWWSERTGINLAPIFDAYLRYAAIPVLEWQFDAAAGQIRYRWKDDEPGFAMPVQLGDPQNWSLVRPITGEWQSMPWSRSPQEFHVATDLYYVDVKQQ